jgi:hypothetical protein
LVELPWASWKCPKCRFFADGIAHVWPMSPEGTLPPDPTQAPTGRVFEGSQRRMTSAEASAVGHSTVPPVVSTSHMPSISTCDFLVLILWPVQPQNSSTPSSRPCRCDACLQGAMSTRGSYMTSMSTYMVCARP